MQAFYPNSFEINQKIENWYWMEKSQSEEVLIKSIVTALLVGNRLKQNWYIRREPT